METKLFSDRLRALIARAKAALPSRAQLRAIVAADQSSPAALRRSHLVYLGIAGTLLGYAVGLVTLLLSAYGSIFCPRRFFCGSSPSSRVICGSVPPSAARSAPCSASSTTIKSICAATPLP